MLSLYRPLNDLFRYEFLQPGWGSYAENTPRKQAEGFSPVVDIVEKDESFEVNVEVAGVKLADIEIEVADGNLTLRGERHDHHESKEGGYRRNERVYGRFERTFTLPKGTESNQIEAHVDAGVLVISVPKPLAKKNEARRIEIKSESFASKAKKVIAKAIENPVPMA